jgi:lipoprotein-anchoring transpeptidase ErfK/SrfK
MLDAVASILVDLSEQRMYVTMESGKEEVLVVSTGKASTPTPVMTDTIDAKYELTDLVGRNNAWRIRDVPHVMCFRNNPMYCIHPRTSGAPIGTPGSLGCVRTTYSDASWLFQRTRIGTTIQIVP